MAVERFDNGSGWRHCDCCSRGRDSPQIPTCASPLTAVFPQRTFAAQCHTTAIVQWEEGTDAGEGSNRSCQGANWAQCHHLAVKQACCPRQRLYINSVDDASFLGWRARLRPPIGGQSVAGPVSAKAQTIRKQFAETVQTPDSG